MITFVKGGVKSFLFSASFVGTPILANHLLLDSTSCQNRARLYNAKECNPYRVSLIPVELNQITYQKRIGSRLNRKNLTINSPRDIQRELSLQDLVDRYINREEKIQLEHKKNLAISPKVQIVPISEESPTINPADQIEALPPSISPKKVEKKRTLTKKRDTKSKKKRTLAKKRDTKSKKKRTLSKKRDTKSEKKRTLTKKRDIKSKKKRVISKSKNTKHTKLIKKISKTKKIIKHKISKKRDKSTKVSKNINKKKAFLSASRSHKWPKRLTHTVKAGETFSHLAYMYATSSYDIRRWNKLKGDYILRIGDKLLVYPGKKSTKDEIRRRRLLEIYGRYKVRKGDTLSKIVKLFRVHMADVCFLNRFSPKTHLRVGKKIVLPYTQRKIDTIWARAHNYYHFKYSGDYLFKHKIRVVATAYTSHRSQTDRTPFMAAWNNRIRPGSKIIAVSPDLIRKYGLTNGVRVKISGLRGIYRVRDKMNARLHNHIDIYMGLNRRGALRWGRRRVNLYW